MPIGTLRRWRESGGFGFIEHGEGDCFCHVTKLRAAGIEFPRDGMVLQFDVVKHSGAKMQASNIILIGDDDTD
jgi:cold shock CspA family protein